MSSRKSSSRVPARPSPPSKAPSPDPSPKEMRSSSKRFDSKLSASCDGRGSRYSDSNETRNLRDRDIRKSSREPDGRDKMNGISLARGLSEKSGRSRSQQGKADSNPTSSRSKEGYKSASGRHGASAASASRRSTHTREDDGLAYGDYYVEPSRNVKKYQSGGGSGSAVIGALRGISKSEVPTLFIAAFEQCHCSVTTTTYHWALFLSDGRADGLGTLYHSRVISHHSLSAGIVSIASIAGPSWPTGFIVKSETDPTSSGTLRHLVFVAEEVPDSDIRQIGQDVFEQYPFNVGNNNCQNWVTRVLRRLRAQGYITQAQYDSTHQRTPHSYLANW